MKCSPVRLVSVNVIIRLVWLMVVTAFFMAATMVSAEIPSVKPGDAERDPTYPPGYMRREPAIHRSSMADLFNPERTLFNIDHLDEFAKRAGIKNCYHLSSDVMITLAVEKAGENGTSLQNRESVETDRNASVTKKSEKQSKLHVKALSH